MDKGPYSFKGQSLSRAVLRSPSHHRWPHDNPRSGWAVGSGCRWPWAQALSWSPVKGVTSSGFMGLICDRKRKVPSVFWRPFRALRFITCRFWDSVLCLCVKARRMKSVTQPGDWERQSPGAFLVLMKSPRVAILSILGAMKAWILELLVVLLEETGSNCPNREARNVPDSLGINRNKSPNLQGTRNETPRLGSKVPTIHSCLGLHGTAPRTTVQMEWKPYFSNTKIV